MLIALSAIPCQQTSARARWAASMLRPRCLAVLTIHLLAMLAADRTIAQQVPPRDGQAEASNATATSFSRDIRPVLSNACFLCHGPDSDSRQADLRLDRPDGLFDERDGATVIRKGDPTTSELVRRILSDDPEVRMPPPDAKKQLTESQKQLLVDWVSSGAEWEQHWAFVPPQKPVVPSRDTTAAGQTANEIDAFLLQKLNAESLDFSPPTERHVLVRRLFLDLIGLPPTIAEQEEWIPRLTPDPEAAAGTINEDQYAALVEYLFAKPEYGERWARHWLDLARYADTNGYEKDRERTIWPYRDWVVEAINSDMPFDQFTIEQLAGDLLPEATQSQKVATGFHRNTMLNEEGGIDPLEFRFHAMTDRVATTGTTWLGLTIGCAQCHTHKYDPITHRDYYQFMALMNNCDEPTIELRPDDFETQWMQNRETADRLLAELPTKWPAESKTTVQDEFSQWLTDQRTSAVRWHNLHPVGVRANLAHLQIQPDDTIFASGDTAKQDYYEIDLAPQDQPMTAIRLEVLPDERLPARGPGTTYYEGTLGDFYLTEFTAKSGDTPVSFRQASHSYARNQYGKNPVSAELTLDGDVQTGWSVFAAQGERNTAVYVLETPVPPQTPLTIRMTFGRHFASALGLFRFAATTTEYAAEHPPIARRMPDDVEQLLLKADDQLTEAERSLLFDAFLLTTAQLTKQADQIRKLRLPPDTTTTLVLSERPAENPRPTFRHHRGEYLQPREPVEPRTPEFLHVWPAEQPKNRLGLARWIIDRQNPLTARVIANRHWAAFFGRGLVATVDDFGVQGERPSHPELLDWLAVTLMDDDGWSIRKLHRRIVTSQAYRQSAVVRPEALAVDPDNRWLAYAPRFRLDAEVIRDSALVGSGKLSQKLGGPPVRPLQPPGITEVAFGSPKWPFSTGEDRYRRSLYTLIKRTAPFAMTTTFDGLSGESCVAQRTRSNTPLQALTLLNDVMFLDLARATGRLVAAQSELTSDAEKVGWLFQRLFARQPDCDELPALMSFVADQGCRFGECPASAADLMGQPLCAEQLADSALTGPVIELAVWTALARSLFSLDEFQVRP